MTLCALLTGSLWLLYWSLERPVKLGVLVLATLPAWSLLSVFMPGSQRIFEASRDIILVATAFSLFVHMRRRSTLVPRPNPAAYVIALLLIAATLFNPNLPNLLVGLVGVRAWLLFPLVFVIGYAVWASGSFDSLIRTSVQVSVPVLIVGVVDAILIAGGGFGVMEQIAPQGAQFFNAAAGFDVGGGRLTRVNSVFTFPLAYFVYSLFILAACSYSVMSRAPSAIAAKNGYLVVALLAGVACLSSGTRLALVAVPLVIASLVSTRGAGSLFVVGGGAVGFGGFVAITGIAIRELPQYLYDLAVLEFEDVVIDGLTVAFETTTFGLGVGSNTNAARDLVDGNLFAAFGGRWQESILAKAWLELGVLGFGLLVTVLILLSLKLVRIGRVSPPHRPLVAFCLILMAISLKGSLLEQAPAGPLFWAVVGALFAFHRSTIAVRSGGAQHSV